jgi:hypothetical protein
MATLKFDGADDRNLLDTLIEAVRLTSDSGERPSIEVRGKVFSPFDLLKVSFLLPVDDLQPHHQAKIDTMFKKRQHGYSRTAANLAHMANSIASNAQRRKVHI